MFGERPLEGIRIVEAAMWAFVPSAGGILADMGARVIKIEPVTGDPIRGLRTGMGAVAAADISWESYNRGKESITLDLKQEAGRKVLDRLLADADVFLTSILPAARRSMGIDEDRLRECFPRLVYATGSAVGQRGPERERGGFDAITFWARGGIADSLAGPEARRSCDPPGPAFGDTLSGSMLAGGICAALLKRERTGKASRVDVSLLNAAMWSMQRAASQAALQQVDRLARPPVDRPNNVLSNTYRTRDGRFVALCMLQSDRYWKPFCLAAGRPDLAGDPRFTHAQGRRDNVDACIAELNALFASRDLDDWRAILARQDGQWDVVQTVGELSSDVQVMANRYFQPVRTTGGTELPLVSVPVQFDGEALPIGAAPDLGSHSDDLLAELGYDEDDIIALKVGGVVF